MAGAPEVVLTMYVIYERPRDYPQGYVVRPQHIVRGRTEPVIDPRSVKTPLLSVARAHVPDGLVNIGRQPDDDEAILEVWT